jgi:hypothetical protein
MLRDCVVDDGVQRPALRGNLACFFVLIVAERARFGLVWYNVLLTACVGRPGESAGIGF